MQILRLLSSCDNGEQPRKRLSECGCRRLCRRADFDEVRNLTEGTAAGGDTIAGRNWRAEHCGFKGFLHSSSRRAAASSMTSGLDACPGCGTAEEL